MVSNLRRREHGALLDFVKPGARVREAVRRCVDALFPPQAFDGGRFPQVAGLSAEAWSKVVFLDAPVCDGCGIPFEYDLGARCAGCQARPFAFARARAACLYDEHSRDLILQFKHGDRTELAGLFAAWLGRSAADLVADADAIVPVPLHPLRLLKRRYNQAAEIARPLAKRAGLEYLPDVLVRGRRTDSQGGKSGSGRRRNVAGAFDVPPAGAKRVKGRRVLLIDDVMTTGATAEACARALLKAGARAVDLGVVSRVRERGDVSI
ncbi:ComF family protein [Caulobacter sp. 17J80-11]|nr:ComF family protein [Caulobacter sp. 17J80-11]